MRPADFDVQRLIDYIQGTCKSLEDAIYDVTDGEMTQEELTSEDHETINNQIFRCEMCSWWSEVCEQDSEGNCKDCSTEEEDEDE